jgi:hypothetical protein
MRKLVSISTTTNSVQQELMRHSDIRTTMNVYGEAASAEMTKAHEKIVGLTVTAGRTTVWPIDAVGSNSGLFRSWSSLMRIREKNSSLRQCNFICVAKIKNPRG